MTLSRCGLEAERSVFIDDTLKNVEAGRMLGFHAFHFRNAVQLRCDLASLGLMPEQPVRADL
jgi:2-haloacid dehalogenase